jgi:hypothetical protein
MLKVKGSLCGMMSKSSVKQIIDIEAKMLPLGAVSNAYEIFVKQFETPGAASDAISRFASSRSLHVLNSLIRALASLLYQIDPISFIALIDLLAETMPVNLPYAGVWDTIIGNYTVALNRGDRVELTSSTVARFLDRLQHPEEGFELSQHSDFVSFVSALLKIVADCDQTQLARWTVLNEILHKSIVNLEENALQLSGEIGYLSELQQLRTRVEALSNKARNPKS